MDPLSSTGAAAADTDAPAPRRVSAARGAAAGVPAQPRNPTWYGFDLDRTLAHYDHWRGVEHIGAPLLPMLEKLKQYLAEGKTCKIFTARVWFDRVLSDTSAKRSVHRPDVTEARKRRGEAHQARRVIEAWCLEHVGQKLEVTCTKDPWCLELWDDIARPVFANGDPDTYTVIGTYPDGEETPIISGIKAQDGEHAAFIARHLHSQLHGSNDGDLLEVNYVFAGTITPILYNPG